ncbi:MAG: GGDEF domain-containing protein [Eubacteriales bacterium]|nr:GGDEF domain-containing protein [Eubacteriales bacterium]
MERLSRVQKLCCAIAALASAVAFIVVLIVCGSLYASDPADRAYGHLALEGVYTSQFSPQPKPIPADGLLESGKEQTTLHFNGHFSSDIPEGQLFVFYLGNSSISMEINGVPFILGNRSTDHFTALRSSDSAWQIFVSPGIRADDQVRIELSPIKSHYAYSDQQLFLTQMYRGYAYPILGSLFVKDLPGLFFSVTIFFMGLSTAIYALFLARSKIGFGRTVLSSLLCISIGLLFFTDLNIVAFAIPYRAVCNSLKILSLCTLITFLLLSLGKQYSKAGRSVCTAVGILHSLYALTTALLWLLADVAIEQSAWIPHFLLALTVLAIAFGIGDAWRHHSYSGALWEMLFSGGIIILGMILDFLTIYLSSTFQSHFFLKISIVLYSVLVCTQSLRHTRSSIDESIRVRMLEAQHAQLEKVCKYQQLISEATMGLYESILEADLTHDCFVGENTQYYINRFHIDISTPYSQAVRMIAAATVHVEDRRKYIEMLHPSNILKEFAQGKESITFVFRTLAQDGDVSHWIQINGRLFYWEEDKSVRLVLFRKNIDSEKQREVTLQQLAIHDSLTGLLNKAAFETRAAIVVKETLPNDYVALFIIDVDYFKTVNDQYGHPLGDRALQAFSGVLHQQFRSVDLTGRIGGDEFAVMMRCKYVAVIRKKAEKLHEALDMQLEEDGKEIHLTASIGVSICKPMNTDYSALFQQADDALYIAKTQGRNTYHLSADSQNLQLSPEEKH